MRALLGADDVSAVPGLHFTMGVDMYTKNDEPAAALRRSARALADRGSAARGVAPRHLTRQQQEP